VAQQVVVARLVRTIMATRATTVVSSRVWISTTGAGAVQERPDAGSTIAALIAAPLLAPTLALVASMGLGTELVSTIQVTPASTVDHSLALLQMAIAIPAMRRPPIVATHTIVDPTAAQDHVVLKVQRLLWQAM